MVLRGWVGFGFGLLFCFVVGVFFLGGGGWGVFFF